MEEEAVITYTRCLEDLDAGKLPTWTNLPAPTIARNYWKLSDNAMLRDVLLAIRADEATHRQYVSMFTIRNEIFRTNLCFAELIIN